jgi:glycosyltransferase involved in cell wall biosynthesis
MRILGLVPSLDGGGTARAMISLMEGLRALGADARLLAGHAEGRAPDLPKGLPLRDLGKPSLQGLVMPLAQVVRMERPDVLLPATAGAGAVAWIAARLAGKPRPLFVLRDDGSPGGTGVVGRVLVRRARRSADALVVPWPRLREDVVARHGLEPDRVAVVAEPLAVEDLAARAEAARQAPPPFPPGGPVVLAIGPLAAEEGHGHLLEAMARLLRRDVRVAILGEGGERSALSEHAVALGLGDRLLLPGALARPEDWLAHAEVFVMTSPREDAGYAITEAMASGAPVISFDGPAAARAVIRDGASGLLLPRGDVPALGRALDRLLIDRVFARSLATEARQDVTRFAASRIARGYLDLFERLVKQR